MKISFIIPFHNEEKNCIPMLKRVTEFAEKKRYDYEIVPVNDRSNDHTKDLIVDFAKTNNRIHPVFRRKNGQECGNTMGSALIEGTNKCQGDIIIWTMGDLADDTKTYGEIIDKLNHGFDMVFGSRYMPGGSRGNLDPIKAFLSSWGTRLARLIFDIPVHDITNAFRGFKRKVFKSVNLNSSGFSISPEFALKAHLSGFKLGEVPTMYTNRTEGVSSFKVYRMARNYLTLYGSLFYYYKLHSHKQKKYSASA